MNVNLGCGTDHISGFINVDLQEPADILHNLDVGPYPFDDETVRLVRAHHVLEHLISPSLFFEQCHRILEPGGCLIVKVPHYSGRTAWGHTGQRRAFSLDYWGWVPGFSVEEKRLNFVEDHPNRRLRLWQRIANFLSNLNPRLCERFFFGFEEQIITLRRR